jgi:hypothetical protein
MEGQCARVGFEPQLRYEINDIPIKAVFPVATPY